MSLRHFFLHGRPLSMYEFEFEYRNSRGVHELTLAYIVSDNENQALLELKAEIKKHHCELLEVVGYPKKIDANEFDEYIHHSWPEYIKALVSRDMIRNHDRHVYVLPAIKIVDS